ncbi:RbsD/FucU family protein [Georgenia yuyongxinii]
MLHGTLIHPQLIGALAAAGHGSTVLITDGNYPVATGARPEAERVFLNLAPGTLTVTQVLEPLRRAVPIELATVMVPEDGAPVEAHEDFRATLGDDVPWRSVGRFEFYDLCREQDLAVVVATGDQRLYANVLLTIGVRGPND